MDWRHSQILELISLYKKDGCLWDCRDMDYKNQIVRNKSWAALASHFDRDPDDIKRKIKNLRNCYWVEKKKIDKLKARKIPYEPHLYYYKQLSFLEQARESQIQISEQEENQLSAALESRTSEVERTNSESYDELIELQEEEKEEEEEVEEDVEMDEDEIAEEINSTVQSRHSSFNESVDSSPELITHKPISKPKELCKSSSPQIVPYKSVKYVPNIPNTKQSEQKMNEMRQYPSKEDTFCAMICSELRLLKSDETYDNVTTEIFIALKNAKSADRKTYTS